MMKDLIAIHPRTRPDNLECPLLQAKLAKLQLQLSEIRRRAS